MAFVKGKSGNPNGRPKHKLADGRSVAEVAREHTDKAINTLVEVLHSDEAPAAAKITAAQALLDRGWGRPAQSVQLGGDPDGVPIGVATDTPEGWEKRLSEAALRELAGLK